MKKLILAAILIICMASVVQAATIQWSAVKDTDSYTIAGYTVHFAMTSNPGQEWTYPTSDPQVADFENKFNIIPGKEYLYSVSAYTDANIHGPASDPIPFTYRLPPLESNLPPVVIVIPGRVEQIIIGDQK